MFRSQVIKRYELPYCTLEILPQNRFCLLIETLDQHQEPVLELSSDRAHLPLLSHSLKQQQQALTPPATQQQETQTLYTIDFSLNEVSNANQINWRQLCDVIKVLDQYQTELKHYSPFALTKKQQLISLLSLIFLAIASTVITGLNLQKNSAKSTIKVADAISEKTVSSTANVPESKVSVPKNNFSQKPNLKLSDSLKKLENLSPPSSISPPSSSLSRETTSSLPRSSIPPLPERQPNLNPPPFPPLNQGRKEINNLPSSQPETLFDRTPQVAEIRKYFQARWQPPQTLKQDIEYQMMINANGSMEKITPLGIVSENYLSTLPLPQNNEPFVSSFSNYSQQKIRLVLRPTGEIKTFLIAARN